MNKNNIVIIIPGYSETSGGIKRMLRLAEQLYIRAYNVGLHVQKTDKKLTNLPLQVTYGIITSEQLHGAETIITYSDDPYILEYRKHFPCVNLLVYMLSFGMATERETAVVKSGAKILCSTEKVYNAVVNNGGNPYLIGFSLEEQINSFYVGRYKREYATIMYHSSSDKNYDLARKVVDQLEYPIIVFGQKPKKKVRLPKNTEHVYYNVDHSVLRRIFNQSKLFINPSVTEGLNLTPLEATLCGCPSILCDGASEIYHNFVNCFISAPEKSSILGHCQILQKGVVDIDIWRKNMYKLACKHTWENVIFNLKGFL